MKIKIKLQIINFRFCFSHHDRPLFLIRSFIDGIDLSAWAPHDLRRNSDATSARTPRYKSPHILPFGPKDRASERESSGSSSNSGRPKGEERGAVFGEERGVKMSWQAYVDDHLMCEIDDMQLTAAAILGLDGSVWAQSATFPQV